MITRERAIESVNALVVRLTTAEANAVDAELEHMDAERALKNEDARIIGAGVEGKNEGERQAKIALQTAGFMDEEYKFRRKAKGARSEVTGLLHELRCWEIIAGMMRGGELQ